MRSLVMILFASVLIAGCSSSTEPNKTPVDLSGKWTITVHGMAQEINIKVDSNRIHFDRLGDDQDIYFDIIDRSDSSFTAYSYYGADTTLGKYISLYLPPDSVWYEYPNPDYKFGRSPLSDKIEDYIYPVGKLKLVLSKEGNTFVGVNLEAREGYVEDLKSRKWMLYSNEAIAGVRR